MTSEPDNSTAALARFIAGADRLVVLTGAGCSTESGIPDYRSPGGAWARHKPIYYSQFVASEDIRRFYWARSFRGWPRFAAAKPNAGHHALAELELRGGVHFLITQNVDDLHQEAGSRKLVQLHGRNRAVVCLDCRAEFPRVSIQERLAELNPGVMMAEETPHSDFAPDGDAAVDREVARTFQIAPCDRCGGVLKPAVVFFGESVPAQTVALAMQRLDEADALLVAGSSLTVWSGFRFVKRAAERKVPVAIVNIGPTRGDALASLKIEARCGEALSAAVRTEPTLRSSSAGSTSSGADPL